jgi:hypothetical protein
MAIGRRRLLLSCSAGVAVEKRIVREEGMSWLYRSQIGVVKVVEQDAKFKVGGEEECESCGSSFTHLCLPVL